MLESSTVITLEAAKKVRLLGADITFKYDGADAELSVADIVGLTRANADGAAKLTKDLADTRDVLAADLGKDINAVKKSFDDTVAKKLEPAVAELMKKNAGLELRLLAQETACNPATQFASSPAKGDTVATFVKPVCKPLTECDFAAGQFEFALPSSTTDRKCKAATVCKADTEFASRALTHRSDRNCAKASVCKDSEFEKLTLLPTRDRVCAKATVCATGKEFEQAAPSVGQDRKCKTYTECKKDEKVLVEPTPKSDRSCVKLTPLVPWSDKNCGRGGSPPSGQGAISKTRYRRSPCEVFDNPSATHWNSEWISRGGDTNSWVGWNFGSQKVKLAAYSLRASRCCRGDVRRSPIRYVVEGYVGGSWIFLDKTYQTKSLPAWKLGLERTFDVPAWSTKKAVTRIRVRGLSGGDGSYMQYSQIQFFGLKV